MTAFTVFRIDSGEVVMTGECPDGQHDLQARGGNVRAIPQFVDTLTQYVDPRTNEPTMKQRMNIAQQDQRIYNLPIPCKIRIEGEEYVIGDGDADLDFEQPGRYFVEVIAPAYITTVVTIDVA
jgi:hypothetical protein